MRTLEVWSVPLGTCPGWLQHPGKDLVRLRVATGRLGQGQALHDEWQLREASGTV